MNLTRALPESSVQDIREVTALICEQTARIAAERYGSALRAVVLTGSLARDEGSFIKEDAQWKLLGDADFFLVFHTGTPLPTTSAADFISHQIGGMLEEKGVVATIGLGLVHGSYFQELPPHIASYELRSCGRVVWGERDILSLVPAFTPEQISLEDAWRMLANRMIELLEAIAESPQPGGAISREAQYCIVKLYLDMATSYLVFKGRYRPAYREREQALRDLANDGSAQADAPFPLRAFADRLSACTNFKLEGGAIIEHPGNFLEDAVLFARLLWTWELAQLTGEAGNISESQLMLSWMRRQPLKSRIRGWASVLRRCGWLQSWSQWPRWFRIGWQSSPRYWIYRVAADLLFRFPELLQHEPEIQVDLQRLSDRLPLSDSLAWAAGATAWQALARMTALNYRRLLESTNS